MPIYKEPGSRFWVIRLNVNGKRLARSSRTTNKRQAESIERKLREELINQHQLGEKESIAFSVIAYEWIDSIPNEETSRKKGYVVKSLLRHIPKKQTIDSITSRQVERLRASYVKEGLKENTIRHYIANLSLILQYAQKLDYKAPKITLPTIKKPKKMVRPISLEEESDIIRDLDSKNLTEQRDFFIFLMDVGCRGGEASIISWDAIDFPENTIHIYRQKVGNESRIPMTRRVREMLQIRKDRNEGIESPSRFVFPGKDKSTHKKNWNDALRWSMDRAGCNSPEKLHRWGGIRITTHSCRKSFASRLASKGVPLLTISKMLGHSSVSTTESTYSHFAPKDTYNNAINVLDDINEREKN